jgi:hypothetical protein
MENDDAALRQAGWTITEHTRRTGTQAGGTYQTWLPPRGRKVLRSRVEIRRHIAALERTAAPTTKPAALPRPLARLLDSHTFQHAAAFSGPRGLGALARTSRALRQVDWAPAWKDVLEARFQVGSLHEDSGGVEQLCRRAVERIEADHSWASLCILLAYVEGGTPRDPRGTYRLADGVCPILWRGPSGVDRSVAPTRGVLADRRFLPAAQARGVRFFFGEPFSRGRNTLRLRFTATEGPSHELLDCAYVGLCVRPVADDASCQVQELDAVFLSAAGFGYGATMEGGSTSPEFTGEDALELSVYWNDRGEMSAQCLFSKSLTNGTIHHLNLRRLLRRDAGAVGLVPVIGLPVGAKATIGSGVLCADTAVYRKKLQALVRRHSPREPPVQLPDGPWAHRAHGWPIMTSVA